MISTQQWLYTAGHSSHQSRLVHTLSRSRPGTAVEVINQPTICIVSGLEKGIRGEGVGRGRGRGRGSVEGKDMIDDGEGKRRVEGFGVGGGGGEDLWWWKK